MPTEGSSAAARERDHATSPEEVPKADVLVVGAGAVGLFLSISLARRGLSVILVERRKERGATSRAIGISSPSLALLAAEGLADRFVSEGIVVRGAVVSDGRRELGHLDFGPVGGEFPFVLTLPQARTEELLEEAVLRSDRVRYYRGVEALSVDELRGNPREAGRVGLHCLDPEIGPRYFEGECVVACEGKRGNLGGGSYFRRKGHSYRDRFIMADFPDRTSWGMDARLFFTPRGSVESFPLPGRRRRWVLSCEAGRREDGGAWLSAEARRRTGVDLDPSEILYESAFGVERRSTRRWAKGRLFLAGDAAHLMSPIVGQNMNTGFADAAWLAAAFAGRRDRGKVDPVHDDRRAFAELGKAYRRARRRPVRAAADRAWAMMRLGTARGGLVSAVRSSLVASALSSSASSVLAGIFTMRSIPGVAE